MNKKINVKVVSAFILLISMVFTAAQVTGDAIIINSDYITIYSGEQGTVEIEIENRMEEDIEAVSVSIVLDNLPFTSVGSNEKSINEIEDDDEEKVKFIIKASTDISPGDYNIPYFIRYKKYGGNETSEKSGTFGLRVSSRTELDFSVETQNPVIGKKGKISLEIINKGFGEIKSSSVQIFPSGYELISKDKIFIGTIESEDSDLVTFDVIFKTANPALSATFIYKDFDNNDQINVINIPLTIYTKEKALELGLIDKPNYIPYIVVISLIIVWIVWRVIKKLRKNKKNRR
jgi:hypothetical protein